MPRNPNIDTSERPFHRKKSVISARLRRNRTLAALARKTRERGISAWIVGGGPRDALMGREALDLDVAVSGGAEDLARELEREGLGTAVVLSGERPRVVRVAGPRDLDLADVEGGSIEADLARRDFTANAMAIGLEAGDWLDPYGGAGDIAAGRLRLVREGNLEEDPLRAFRAARFSATHGLRPDRRIGLACRRIAPRLASVAPERIATELSKLLAAPKAAPAFRWAARAGLLAPALGLEPRRGFGASARHLAALDALAPSRRPEPWRAIRLAAIAAGAGLSADRAVSWLRRRRFGRAEAGAAGRLLELASAVPARPSGPQAWEWIYDAGELAPAALALLRAIRPRAGAFAAGLARLRHKRARTPVPVTGEDVMDWLLVAPGPRVGEVLRAAGIEWLRGSLRTRARTREWLRGRFGPG